MKTNAVFFISPFFRRPMICARTSAALRAVFTLFLLLLYTRAPGAMLQVTNTNDIGPGSLRDAITMYNLMPQRDTINFAIPGAGLKTIRPLSQLPILFDTAGVFINGFSQPGASPGVIPPMSTVLQVELNGAKAGASHGLWILSPNNIIHGLVIDSFEQDGIRIQGMATGTYNNIIYGNFIGTDSAGNKVQGNGWNITMFWAGVDIVVTPEPVGFAHHNMVYGNLISGNYAEGVAISNCPPGDVFQNIVRKNLIGVDVTGMIDFGNAHDGVYIGEGAHHNLVDSNLISGNDFEGVCIVGYAALGIISHNNAVTENLIGLSNALTPLPNTGNGVSIGKYGSLGLEGHAVANIIGPRNIIAGNGRSGIMVWEHPKSGFNADSSTITLNSIYGNGVLGIDLMDDTVTANDPADIDTAANQEVNFPVITAANNNGTQTTISGTVAINTPPQNARVEVFAVTAPSPRNYGEGGYYLGSATPAAAGSWTLTTADTMAKTGKTVTATVADMDRNTSEFALNVTVSALVNAQQLRPSWRDFNEVTVTSRSMEFLPVTFQYPSSISSYLNLRIYNVNGKLVRVLADEPAGFSKKAVFWDCRNSKGQTVRPGTYICALRTEEGMMLRRIVLMK